MCSYSLILGTINPLGDSTFPDPTAWSLPSGNAARPAPKPKQLRTNPRRWAFIDDLPVKPLSMYRHGKSVRRSTASDISQRRPNRRTGLIESRSTPQLPQLAPINQRQHDGITRSLARAQPIHRHEAVLGKEPSHLFLIDRTLGVYVDHHRCDKPIPDQSSASAFQDSPHVPCDDVLIDVRQSFSLVLGETLPSPKLSALILYRKSQPLRFRIADCEQCWFFLHGDR